MAVRVVDGTWDGVADWERTRFRKELKAMHKSSAVRSRVAQRLFTNIAEYAEDPIGTRSAKASPVSGHKGLFEARASHDRMIFRMLFDFDGAQPRALCAFQKKSQSLPQTHVDHALDRSKLNRRT